MSLLARRRMMKVSKQTEPVLPAAYQRVEWIGSSGTQKLRVTPTQTAKLNDGTWAAEIDFSATGTGSSGGILATCQEPGYWLGVDGSGKIGNISMTERKTVNVSWSTTGRTDSINGIVVSSRNYDTQYNQAGQLSMFAIPNGLGGYGWNYPATAKMYRCKIYKNGVIYRDLIPCYRISDTTIGMYDTVGESFYTNVGTGTFTKGADVT